MGPGLALGRVNVHRRLPRRRRALLGGHQHGDLLGVVVDALRRLADSHGELFAPAPLLEKLAAALL